VQLTQAQVWSDVRQVLTATAELGALRAARMRGAAVGNAGAALSRLIAAYKGEFLPGGEEPPWLLAARARLGKAFSTAVMQASEADLPAADLTAALEHALQIDPTAEELTRALMTHYLRHGERAAALRVYRRCREILSVVLGLRPSAATEALLQEINGAARGGDAAPQGRMRS
jgi:LuxR family maltose regulon positive regulatory protein